MDWEYQGCSIIEIHDPRPANKKWAEMAQKFGNGWQAVECFYKFEGIQFITYFLFDSTSGVDLDYCGKMNAYNGAREIEMRRGTKPIYDDSFTDADPVITEIADPGPANIIEPGGGENSNEIANRKYLKKTDQAYGNPAEMAVLDYFIAQLGDSNVVHFPFGQYDVDIKIRLNEFGKWYFIDVENRAQHWVDPEWPDHFDSVHVPRRKEKMIKTRLPFYYYIVNRDLTRALVLAGPDILAAEIAEIKGNYEVSKVEPYFNVSREKIKKYIDLK